jgi:hypothetical protein
MYQGSLPERDSVQQCVCDAASYSPDVTVFNRAIKGEFDEFKSVERGVLLISSAIRRILTSRPVKNICGFLLKSSVSEMYLDLGVGCGPKKWQKRPQGGPQD